METATLTARKCVACTSDTPVLRPEEIEQYRPQVPDWSVEEGKRLRRSYRFKDFATALGFVNEVGRLAEEEWHHPDICLSWGQAEVVLWTHKIGGLSENDFIMAAKADKLAESARGFKGNQ